MNLTKWLCFCSVIFAASLNAQEDSYRLVRETDLKHALVSPYGNVIKLYDTAVDSVRGRAYVSGSQTEFVAIVDLDSAHEIGNVTLPFNSTLHTLDCNPANGFLYVTKINESPAKLYAIDPSSSEIKGTYSFSDMSTGLAFDVSQNLTFLADGPEIKVLDGSSLGVMGSIVAGMSVGGLAIDSVQARLYAVSRNLINGKAVVKTFDLHSPYALQRKFEVASTVALGNLVLDAGRNRLLLLGKSHIQEINATTGAWVRTIVLPSVAKSPAYDDHRQALYLTDEDGYSADGEGGSWSKLYRYDFVAGQLDSLRMGDKTTTLAIDNRRDILVVPSMHSGWLEMLHLDSGEIDSVDTGETADEMALSPDRTTLFIADRLGGSRIVAYDRAAGSVSTFRAGVWPAVVETDSSLNKLYVLNVFQSSISVIDPSSRQVTNTIRLSIPEARTDAIPVMHYEASQKKLYLAFPEFEKIFVVDLMSESEEKSFELLGFHFDSEKHAAIGVIQLAAVPQHNRLYVLQKEERKLKVFDLNTFALLDSLDVSAWWPKNTTFAGYLLGYDPVFDRLYLGNRFIDPLTLTSEAVFAGQLFVGYAPDRSKFYSIAEQGGLISLFEVDRISMATIAKRNLFQPSGTAAPVFFHDPYSNEFFISEFNYAVLRHYDLNQLSTGIETNSNRYLPYEFSLKQNYPNPFNPVTIIQFTTPIATHVTLKVYDFLGREVATLVDGEMAAGDHDVTFGPNHSASGIYFFKLVAGKFSQTRKALLMK